jgi:hypothetical protein
MKYSPSMGPTVWGKMSPGLAPSAHLVGLKPHIDDARRRPRLEVHLSSQLVDRKIVQVSVQEKRGSNHMEVELRHLGPFDLPRPGQYAWQREYDGLRPLQVPLEAIAGAPGVVARLARLLSNGCECYVQVRPDRVSLRLVPRGSSWSIRYRGSRYVPQESVAAMLRDTVGIRGARGLNPCAEMVYTPTLEYGRRTPLPPHRFIPLTPDWLAGDWAPLEGHEDREEHPMLIPAGTRIIGVNFPTGGKTYHYYTDDASITIGDYVVVVSPNSSCYGAQTDPTFDKALGGYPVVVRVETVEETLEAIEKVAKWVVTRVDLQAYAKRIETEESIRLLRAKIAKAEKQAREMLELENLRSLSPELGTLLDELKALTGTK